LHRTTSSAELTVQAPRIRLHAVTRQLITTSEIVTDGQQRLGSVKTQFIGCFGVGRCLHN